MKMSDTAHAIVQDILTDLKDRAGFEELWWDDIETDIQQEIKDDLFNLVFEKLEQMS